MLLPDEGSVLEQASKCLEVFTSLEVGNLEPTRRMKEDVDMIGPEETPINAQEEVLGDNN